MSPIAPNLLPCLYANLVYAMTSDRLYENLFSRFEEAIGVAAACENAPLEAYVRGARALALLDLGHIGDAIEEAKFVLHGAYPHGTPRFNAEIALARALIRTGAPEDGALDAIRAMPTSHRAPLAIVDAEAIWLGLPRPGALERLRYSFDTALRAQGQRWTLADTALWLKILQEPVEIPDRVLATLRPAHRAHILGQWREAADAWAEMGCTYEQAIALSMGDGAARLEALQLFDGLGAAPAASRLRRSA